LAYLDQRLGNRLPGQAAFQSIDFEHLVAEIAVCWPTNCLAGHDPSKTVRCHKYQTGVASKEYIKTLALESESNTIVR